MERRKKWVDRSGTESDSSGGIRYYETNGLYDIDVIYNIFNERITTIMKC